MKKLLSFLIVGAFLLSIVSGVSYAEDNYTDLFDAKSANAEEQYKQKFWDVDKNYWAFTAIAELTERGAINGYSDGSFKPKRTVTRAEWAKIMIQAAGLTANDYSVKFTDMNGHWAAPYVNAASNYLTAFSDNSYRPDQAVTREDVTMAMVKLKGYDLSEVDYSALSGFKDTSSISNSMKVYVAIAVEKGLITGYEDGTFRGQATLTRAEAATLLWRAFQFGSDNKTTAASTGEYNRIENNNTAIQLESKNTTSQGSSILTMATVEGAYWDTINKVPEMYVKKKNDIYKIKIYWDLNERESTAWFFDAKVDKSSGDLEYKKGYKFRVSLKNDGTVQWDLESDKCEGSFAFEESFLIWNDYSEDLSKRCKFAKSEVLEEEDYTYLYEEATKELEAYVDSFLVVDKRIDGKYNWAKAKLLSCLGYKDSDELLKKLESIHKIALKIRPDGFYYMYKSCDARIRDNTFLIEYDLTQGIDRNGFSLKFAYDYTSYDAVFTGTIYTNYLGKLSSAGQIGYVVSLFAENYKDAEFKRLLEEAYSAAGGGSTELEMHYGGYNLKIIIEEASSYAYNAYVSGKKISSSSKIETYVEENAPKTCNGALLCGKVQEIETGSGYSVLVFDFDSPKNISFETLEGDVVSNQSFSSIQIGIDNYTPNMAGKHLEIIDYTTPFEAHTQHHIRPIVMLDAKVRVIN